MAPPSARLAMCQLAAHIDDRIYTSSYEITQHIDKRLTGSATIDMIQLLLSDNIQKHEYSYVIGMDNANHIDQWFKSAELRKLIPFVVVPRSGEKRNEEVDWYLKTPHVLLKPSQPLLNTASSRIRDGDDAAQSMVDDSVWRYIVSHGLYHRE